MRSYDPDELKRELGPVEMEEAGVSDGQLPPGNFREVKLRWQRDLPHRARRLLFNRSANGDRSEVLYKLGGILTERGVPYNDAWWLLYGSAWGQSKYANRPEEIHRILAKHEAKREQSPKKRKRKRTDDGWEDLYRLLGKDLPAPRWLVEGVWGLGNYGMLAGQAKSHKTWLTLDLAISVSSGKPFLGKYPINDPGPVMVVEAEVRRHSMRYRSMLIANSKGLHPQVKGKRISIPQVHPLLLRRDTHMDLLDEDHMKSLVEKVEKVQPKLLVLDPLQFMMGEGDENSATDVRQVLVPLAEVALTYETSVVIVHHFKKNYEETTRGGYRLSGSQAFHAWGESNLWIEYVANNAVKVEREFRDFDSPGDMEVVFDIRGEDYDPWVYEHEPNVIDAERKISPLASYVRESPGCSAKQLGDHFHKGVKTVRKMVERDQFVEFREVTPGRKGGRPRQGVFPLDT